MLKKGMNPRNLIWRLKNFDYINLVKMKFYFEKFDRIKIILLFF